PGALGLRQGARRASDQRADDGQGRLSDMDDADTMGERVVARMHAAMNAHDIEAFVACFAEDYASAQPAPPGRAFRGREQVRANWSAIFGAVPDFRAELVGVTVAGETAWSEWRWQGAQTDGGGARL